MLKSRCEAPVYPDFEVKTMAMDRINSPNLVRQGLVDKYKGAQKAKDADRDASGAGAAEQGAARPAQPADSVQISDAARKLVDLREAVDAGRAALGELPEVRDDKIAAARKRLEQGFYNSPEVTQEVAARLSKVMNDMEEL